MIAAGPHKGFGLYIHWPYCAHICPYCDFNVYAAKARDPAPLVDAIIKDLKAHKPLMEDHPRAGSLYLGGGTPSLLPPYLLGALVEAARQWPGLTEDAEITLEANPNDILNGDTKGWHAAGITRLSIGVQSLDDDALKFLGRDHSAQTALQAIEKVQAKFPALSMDLIYARPDQTTDAWTDELGRALTLGIEHLSLYELTIAQKTAFGHAMRRGNLTPMPADDQADLYELTEELTQAAGWPAYEVSNYAKPAGPDGRANQSRHNLTYWRSGDWIGLGPGAHGRLTLNGQRHETIAYKRPVDYISQMTGDTAPAWQESAIMSPEAVAIEALAMGLRPLEGIDIRPIEALLGRSLSTNKMRELIDSDLLVAHDTSIALTASGGLLADRITHELLDEG